MRAAGPAVSRWEAALRVPLGPGPDVQPTGHPSLSGGDPDPQPQPFHPATV